MFSCHDYEILTEEKRPQDPDMDGSGLTFTTLEHGGKYPDMMPQAIRVTDADGKTCVYVPITEQGQIVDSKGYTFSALEGVTGKRYFSEMPPATAVRK